MTVVDEPFESPKTHFTESVKSRSNALLSELASSCAGEEGLGSFSATVYDSAWLATITKSVGGKTTWLFPECFSYVLAQQDNGGSWLSYKSQVDGILNTGAGLLALCVHQDPEVESNEDKEDFGGRIGKASNALAELLNAWVVGSTVHVGFEILVPGLLHLLAERGHVYDFPGQAEIEQLYQQKMANFRPEMVYTKHLNTIHHSLEALVGKIDFDSVKHHVNRNHGIMGSPASTAAYLSHCSQWDEDAESYLRSVVDRFGSTGGVPSAYPTPVFEISWTVNILNGSDLLNPHPDSKQLDSLKAYLSRLLKQQKGITGFAPGLPVDADDTAKSIEALHCLGEQADLAPLVETFEAESHFKTYVVERNPSFSANCNVLTALLDSHEVVQYSRQIEKAASFLVGLWKDGDVNDKWNLAPEYSQMSLGHGLVKLLKIHDKGDLCSLDTDLTSNQIPLVLCQLFSCTLKSQLKAGSWSSCVETSAYAIILLSNLLTLPWSDDIRQAGLEAIQIGREFLIANSTAWKSVNYLWVEKVTYGLPILSEAYCLAAMSADSTQADWSPTTSTRFASAQGAGQKMVQMFTRLPLFKEVSPALLSLAQIEASHLLQRLKSVRLEVFSERDKSMTKDKYLSFIPFAWTSCKVLSKMNVPDGLVWDMIVISLLNYQADEFMESAAADYDPQMLGDILSMACDADNKTGQSHGKDRNKQTIGHNQDKLPTPLSELSANDECSSQDLEDDELQRKVHETLQKFTSYVLQHEAAISSPISIQNRLAEEIRTFLLAHAQHNADNRRLRKKPATTSAISTNTASATATKPQRSFFDWVRTTGADDTSCPYSFLFFCCLISTPGEHCLQGPRQTYYGAALCRSLATMCRQYNDWGSIARDRAEGNLNSVDFSEFSVGDITAAAGGQDTRKRKASSLESEPKSQAVQLSSDMDGTILAKAALMDAAEFERACMQMAFRKLQEVTSAEVCEKLQLFINVTDLFGQIYVAKDIASRVK